MALRFDSADFELFELPDFSDRMLALKSQVTPKLKELGQLLTPLLSEMAEETLYPHVAMHIRRSVHPPPATWVAFSPTKRAYKPYVHLRVAVSDTGLRVAVQVEDYADEKLLFASALSQNAQSLAKHFKETPGMMNFDPHAGLNGSLYRASKSKVQEIALDLKSVKTRHASVGLTIPPLLALAVEGTQLLDLLLDRLQQVLPVYQIIQPYRKNPDVG